MVSNAPAAPTDAPSFAALPIVQARDVIDHLKKAGVALSNDHELAIADTWKASQEFQFDVRQGSDKGTFVILSYTTLDLKVSDIFKVNATPRFKNWQVMNASNILMLVSPETRV